MRRAENSAASGISARTCHLCAAGEFFARRRGAGDHADGRQPAHARPRDFIAPIPRDRRATVMETSLRKPQFSQGHVGATAVEKDRQPRPVPELRN
jgi:hypothetical protein